jgi:mycothiol synthase
VTERPVREDDFAALAGVFRALEEHLWDRPSRVDENSVRAWTQRTNLADDSLLIEEDGRPVGAVFAEAHGPLGSFAGLVHPEAQGRGLGTRLADFAEARLVGRGPERLQTWIFAGEERARELFSGRGYREVRRFWDMAIELAEPPPQPDVAIEVFDGSEERAREFHAALGEAFEDHWEHHPVPFEEWWEEKRAVPDYDPSLWFLIRAGGEVAAVVRNDPDRNGGGYVGALGVRRAWRGRGYGRALLLHTFREFHRRGQTRVTLGVDAANPTGATRLYESAGMHVESESVVYEKALA